MKFYPFTSILIYFIKYIIFCIFTYYVDCHTKWYMCTVAYFAWSSLVLKMKWNFFAPKRWDKELSNGIYFSVIETILKVQECLKKPVSQKCTVVTLINKHELEPRTSLWASRCGRGCSGPTPGRRQEFSELRGKFYFWKISKDRGKRDGWLSW